MGYEHNALRSTLLCKTAIGVRPLSWSSQYVPIDPHMLHMHAIIALLSSCNASRHAAFLFNLFVAAINHTFCGAPPAAAGEGNIAKGLTPLCTPRFSLFMVGITHTFYSGPGSTARRLRREKRKRREADAPLQLPAFRGNNPSHSATLRFSWQLSLTPLQLSSFFVAAINHTLWHLVFRGSYHSHLRPWHMSQQTVICSIVSRERAALQA